MYSYFLFLFECVFLFEGGYATIYLNDKTKIMSTMSSLRSIPGIYTVLNREEAARAFDLPGDRIGDIVVLADESSVLGKSEAYHDLSQVPSLRSHGSISEATVPFFMNTPLESSYHKRLTSGKMRNYELFDYLLNGQKQIQQEKQTIKIRQLLKQ
jgi:phosphonoacetate hydrolase